MQTQFSVHVIDGLKQAVLAYSFYSNNASGERIDTKPTICPLKVSTYSTTHPPTHQHAPICYLATVYKTHLKSLSNSKIIYERVLGLETGFGCYLAKRE